MSIGIRCWDASGNIILNLTDRLGRYHSSVTIPAISSPNQTVRVYVPGMSTDGTWFYIPTGQFYVTVTMGNGYFDAKNVRPSGSTSSFNIAVLRG